MKATRRVAVAIVFCVLVSVSLAGAQTLQTLVSFSGTKGANLSPLAKGKAGDFYGTTEFGGITNSTFSSGMGTVFKMATNGTLTTLVTCL